MSKDAAEVEDWLKKPLYGPFMFFNIRCKMPN